MELTTQQVRFFRDVGYLRFPERIGADLIGQLCDFLQFERVDGAPEWNSLTTEKLYRLYQRNPVLIDKLVRHPAIIDPLRSLLGNNIVFLTNRHNHGTAHSGHPAEPPRLHRDILQWSRSLVTVLVYLEDSCVENGCTHVVPGSHYLPFIKAPSQTGGTWMDEHTEFRSLLDQAVPIPMAKGSILTLDATVFHTAGENKDGKTRTSITLAYRSVDELNFNPDKKRTILVSGEYLYRGNDKV